MPHNPLAHVPTAQLITELRRRTTPIGPTESGWIVGFLPPGSPFGRDRLTSEQHGVELECDTTIVDTPAELVRLGLDLIETFESFCRHGKRPSALRLPTRTPRDT
jgi:hypothetical protein